MKWPVKIEVTDLETHLHKITGQFNWPKINWPIFNWPKRVARLDDLVCFTLLFTIPRTVLLSSIQPEAETVPTHLREIFRKSSHQINTNKGIVKQFGNDVVGCRSQKILFSTQYARISAIQCIYCIPNNIRIEHNALIVLTVYVCVRTGVWTG